MPPMNEKVVVGDQVQPECIMEDFMEYEAINCLVNGKDNKVTFSFDAEGCDIHLTAEEEGEVELSCTVVCAQTTPTYTMSWTAEAGEYDGMGVTCCQQLDTLCE